jgi:hypothetical protein
MRAPGMSMDRIPLFVWAVFITAWLLLLALPVLAGTLSAPIYENILDSLSIGILAVYWNSQFAHLEPIGQSVHGVFIHAQEKAFLISCLDSSWWETLDKGILRDFTPEQSMFSSMF